LWQAAQTVTVASTLNPTNPSSRSGMNINNLKLHSALWGPPNRITISLTKNNVWDRRLHEFHAPTLQEMTEGAFSPLNKEYAGVKENDSTTFAVVDITDLPSLANNLAANSNAVSAYLNTRLHDKTKDSLAAYQATRSYQSGRVLMTNLVADFNVILDGPSLYGEKPFRSIVLRPETGQWLKDNPPGAEARRLNRLLLEDAYPEISRRPGNSLRPLDLGWLRKEGGSVDPYRYPMRYAFPCLKAVGQIILGIDPLAGAAAPLVTQGCANGVTSLDVTNGNAEAHIEYALEMTNDIYAIRGSFRGITTPIWLRLYRHRDTPHMTYMTADGRHYTNPAAEKDKAFNGPIDPPASGTSGRYFWIRQKMPAEKTFPHGFEYVLMGVINNPGKVKLDSLEGKTGLGTPPANSPMPWDWFGAPRPSIADEPGAAATATFTPGKNGRLQALVTVVTTMDGPDLIAIAKMRLAAAEASRFDGVVQANNQWWNALYTERETGRVFDGETGTACSDNIHDIYQSWTDSHGGGTKTDMRKLECSASYSLPERDFQDFDGAPCYNEIFCTSRFVHNWGDSEDMWKQIVEYWTPGGQENARDRFDMPGMLITHGYLPLVKPDKYVHTTIALELCLGTMAEIIRPAWDEWDFGGDTNFLRQECYPMLKQMARFYAAYAKKGDDGYYHIITSMEEERWGIYPKFARSK
jgi:hypothetical protein